MPDARAVALTASSVLVRSDAKLTELDAATLAVKREVALPPGIRVLSEQGRPEDHEADRAHGSGEVVAARCAPDGKRVAWLAKDASGVELRVVDR